MTQGHLSEYGKVALFLGFYSTKDTFVVCFKKPPKSVDFRVVGQILMNNTFFLPFSSYFLQGGEASRGRVCQQRGNPV